MLIYCIYKLLLKIIILQKLDRIEIIIFFYVTKYEYQSKMYQKKLANLITFESYIMCRIVYQNFVLLIDFKNLDFRIM
jgi:hypothetical protein